MPMLAERRRKTKWTNHGRQALWNRDSSDATFGRGMMEKMGWKVGQGLGANEQGIKEPLKISFKNDNKGVGFKENDNEWIQQQFEFDEFLSKLSSEKKELSKDSPAKTVQSLEERSRLSKARVHYHKFTRGKDLAKYSKKDLECILGKSEKESSTISSNMESCNENVGTEDKSLVIAGSMVDYFAKKMQGKIKKKDDSLDVMDPEMGKSLMEGKSRGEMKETVVEPTMELDGKRAKKSKKKKEKDEDGCNEGPLDEVGINNSDPKMKFISEGCKKSKSKKTKVYNPSDPLHGNGDSENITVENELMRIPKEEENILETILDGDEIPSEKLKKKKKKRKKEENLIEEFDMGNVEVMNVIENKNQECEEAEEKVESLTLADRVKKKKKTCKRNREAIIDEEDDGGIKENTKKKCLEVKNSFNDEDCGTNQNDINSVCDMETNFKKNKKEKRKTKCESALEGKQENKTDGMEGFPGEGPLFYKGELLKKEYSLKSTSRNKLLNLIYSTNIQQFSGSNLAGLTGYGIVSHR